MKGNFIVFYEKFKVSNGVCFMYPCENEFDLARCVFGIINNSNNAVRFDYLLHFDYVDNAFEKWVNSIDTHTRIIEYYDTLTQQSYVGYYEIFN